MRFIFLLVCFIASSCVAQQDSIDKYIESKMAEQKLVGLSIGIIRNGQIVKSTGYGIANADQQYAADANTVYKLASISKHMVAVGIMKLYEDGKLKLSDTITKYFNAAPSTWNKISIRHLLNHTSGLPRESPGFRFNVAQPDSVLIQLAYNEPLLFPTGTSWDYCNLGYFILADIIRKVSGLSFPQFMEKEIFAKNGMNYTKTTAVHDINPNRALGYFRRGQDTLIKADPQIALRPSGAFVSSVNDMLKWESLIEQKKIISGATWQKMWTDTVLTNRKNNKGGEVYYGYGFQITRFNDKKLVFHGGSLPGFRTGYFRFPDDNTAFIILANADQADISTIAWGVADILFNTK